MLNNWSLNDCSRIWQVNFDNNDLGAYIPENSNRYRHILGVVRKMRQILQCTSIADYLKQDLITAAYMHDIGYSAKVNVYNFHPLDGALFCQQQKFSKPVTSAVLYHTLADRWAKQSYPNMYTIYVNTQHELSDLDRLFIDFVTYCDLHISLLGEDITLEQRISSVINRYGILHPTSVFMTQNSKNFMDIIARVNSMMRCGC